MTRAKYPTELVIGGRRYLKLAMAAQQVGYSPRSIDYMVRVKGVRQVKHGSRNYVCISDLRSHVDRQQAKQSKIAQLRTWWSTHPLEQSVIQDHKDFLRRLTRDGLDISPSLARTFLAEVRPRTAGLDRVLAWLEADPKRLALPMDDIRLLVTAEKRVDVSLRMVKRARMKYYRMHGKPEAPDPTRWASAEEVARMLGVTRTCVQNRIYRGKLIGQVHHHTTYVLRASINQFLEAR